MDVSRNIFALVYGRTAMLCAPIELPQPFSAESALIGLYKRPHAHNTSPEGRTPSWGSEIESQSGLDSGLQERYRAGRLAANTKHDVICHDLARAVSTEEVCNSHQA